MIDKSSTGDPWQNLMESAQTGTMQRLINLRAIHCQGEILAMLHLRTLRVQQRGGCTIVPASPVFRP